MSHSNAHSNAHPNVICEDAVAETDEERILRRQIELEESRGRHKTAMSRQSSAARRARTSSSSELATVKRPLPPPPLPVGRS
jgi:hypothetical protein